MRKYLKPALEIEAFDVEDVITASVNQGVIDGNQIGGAGNEAMPIIDVIEIN